MTYLLLVRTCATHDNDDDRDKVMNGKKFSETEI